MLIDRITAASRNPLHAAYALWAKLDHPGLFRRYVQLSRAAGLDKLYFVLSFDCDTPDDIAVVEGLHARLTGMGIKPVYAVPGELLQEGEKVYGKIADSGAEFINHGYTRHTYLDRTSNRYASCFFYDTLSPSVIRNDIIQGDACLKKVLGIQPRGFRTPHFGTFQKPHQLRFIHSILQELGYEFSTSTVPLYSFRYGPLFRRFSLQEIPVSGMVRSPLTILDTWSCFMAPDRVLNPDDYTREGEAAADLYRKLGAGLLNYYADPVHIHSSDLFFSTVARWQSVAQSVTYFELLTKLS